MKKKATTLVNIQEYDSPKTSVRHGSEQVNTLQDQHLRKTGKIQFFQDLDLYKVYLKGNVPKVKVEKIIRAEKDKVFSIMTDFENLPSKLPHIFKSVKVISREGNSLVTEEFVKMAGIYITQRVKHVIQPTEKHEVFILEGDAKDSHIVESYEKINGGTKIIVEGDFKLAGKLKLLGFFAKGEIEKRINKVMDEFAKILTLTKN